MRYGPEQAARVAYAAIRQLREEQGCQRGPVWALLVGEERAWYRAHIERAASGMLTAEMHGAWRRELEAEGWTAAPEIDHLKRTHPELVPWDALTEQQRRRFFVLQMLAVGLYLEIPPVPSDLSPVTAL